MLGLFCFVAAATLSRVVLEATPLIPWWLYGLYMALGVVMVASDVVADALCRTIGLYLQP